MLSHIVDEILCVWLGMCVCGWGREFDVSAISVGMWVCGVCPCSEVIGLVGPPIPPSPKNHNQKPGRPSADSISKGPLHRGRNRGPRTRLHYIEILRVWLGIYKLLSNLKRRRYS